MSDDVCGACTKDIGIDMPSPDWHPECGLRMVLGGIGHLTNHAYWCGEVGDPDAGHTYRASALLVAEWVRRRSIEEAAAIGRSE